MHLFSVETEYMSCLSGMITLTPSINVALPTVTSPSWLVTRIFQSGHRLGSEWFQTSHYLLMRKVAELAIAQQLSNAGLRVALHLSRALVAVPTMIMSSF